MQKCYEWSVKMKKEGEKKQWRNCINKRVTRMIKSAAELLHKITKLTSWRGGAQILKKEEDARLLDRCEAKRKDWAKHWQCDEEVPNVEDKPWKNGELRKWEEALPRLKECELGKSVEIV